MKVQFMIDILTAWRHGKSPPSSMVSLDLPPRSCLTDEQFQLLSKHLQPHPDATDVVCAWYDPEKARQGVPIPPRSPRWDDLVVANEATLESLFQALEQFHGASTTQDINTVSLVGALGNPQPAPPDTRPNLQ